MGNRTRGCRHRIGSYDLHYVPFPFAEYPNAASKTIGLGLCTETDYNGHPFLHGRVEDPMADTCRRCN